MELNLSKTNTGRFQNDTANWLRTAEAEGGLLITKNGIPSFIVIPLQDTEKLSFIKNKLNKFKTYSKKEQSKELADMLEALNKGIEGYERILTKLEKENEIELFKAK